MMNKVEMNDEMLELVNGGRKMTVKATKDGISYSFNDVKSFMKWVKKNRKEIKKYVDDFFD